MFDTQAFDAQQLAHDRVEEAADLRDEVEQLKALLASKKQDLAATKSALADTSSDDALANKKAKVPATCLHHLQNKRQPAIQTPEHWFCDTVSVH